MGVSTSIQLIDQMTAPILKITDSINHMISSFEEVQRAGDNSLSGIDFGSFRNDINEAVSSTLKLKEEMNKTPSGQEKLNQKIREGSSGMDGLTRKVIGLVGAYASIQGLSKVIELSDQITSTTARLDMIVDDGGSISELEAKIRASANRSRADYLQTADVVAKMQSQAGHVFGSNDETIAFTELLNKQFVIAGNNAQQIDSVVYNLTQAMAQGALRGQDLNSVLQNTPQIAQAIADYMGISVGEIKEYAEQGLISADIVKNAILSNADEINASFENMPKTFAQMATLFKNQALEIFDPVLKKIGEIANSEWFQQMSDQALTALMFIAYGLEFVIDGVSWLGQAIANNMDIVIAVLLVVAGYFIYLKIEAIKSFLVIAAGSIAALWPLYLIIAVVVAIIAVLRHFGITGTEVFAAVVGGINVAIQWCKNFGLAVANIALGIWEAMKAMVGNIGIAFTNAGLNIKSFFQGLVATILNMIANIAEALSKLPFVEFDYDGLRSQADSWASAQAETQAQKEDYLSVSDAFSNGNSTFNAFQDGWAAEAYNSGYQYGEGIANKIGDFTSSIGGAGDGGFGALDFGQGISNNIADTAGNTKKIADSVEVSEENLKYMRDIAEQEAINRFTTAEINVNNSFGDTNVSSNMDLDGVINYITDGLVESVESTAGGLHN